MTRTLAPFGPRSAAAAIALAPLLLLLTSFATGSAQTTPSTAAPCTRIVIDPGHNSRANLATEPIGPGSSVRKIKDGGGTRGVATGVPEHVLTVEVALLLRTDLLKAGYCVTMTRTRDTGLSAGNIARARIANRVHAALSIRIHADGSPTAAANGTSVLYPALHEGWTDDILPASRRAARLMQSELVKTLASRDLGTVARTDITGFNWSDVPVVLPELGFMTNPREDRLLNTPAYQQRAAQAMTRAVLRFVRPRLTPAGSAPGTAP